MFETMPESQGKILGVKATGMLTQDDYDQFLIPRLEEIKEEYGSARLLLYLPEEFEGWEPEAMLEDFRIGIGRFRNDFEKFALVGGPKWVKLAMKLDDFLIKADIKTFEEEQLIEAWSWLKM